MAYLNWLHAAADEIREQHVKQGRLQRVDIAGIIAKHCPMKADTAYMEVPRCESCRHWTPFPEELQPKNIGGFAAQFAAEGLIIPSLRLPNLGDCEMFTDQESTKLEVRRQAAAIGHKVTTQEDFGCVQWEAK